VKNRCFSGLAAIALLSLTACQSQPSTPEVTPEGATNPPMTETAADLPTGLSLSADGQALVMEGGSTLEAYCSGGGGVLAISPAAQAGDTQVLGCVQSSDLFDATVTDTVAPVITDGALQLQDMEYVSVSCQADHAGLAPVLPDQTGGHMSLECI
jgi:hypothetical protein